MEVKAIKRCGAMELKGCGGPGAAETQSYRQAGVRGAETMSPQSRGDRKVETCS